MEALTKPCDEMLQSAPSGRSKQQLPARLDKPMVVGEPAVRTHSRCQPRAVACHVVAGIGQQPFCLADKFFMQVRLLFEDIVDI